MFNTREEWLEAAAGQLLALFPEDTAFPPLKVSVGWPKGRGRARGQCYYAEASQDKITCHLFISPTLEDVNNVVLPVLLHELIHTVTPGENHRGGFVKVAQGMGFVKPFTQATCTDGLIERLAEVSHALGPYPHIALINQTRVKQATRMLLWSCPCGDTFRRALKNIDGKPCHVQCMDCGGRFTQKRGKI